MTIPEGDADIIGMQDIHHVMGLTADGSPTAAFAAVDALATRIFQPDLLTITRTLLETMEVERVYSSDPVNYPIGGRNQKRGTAWGDKVLIRREIRLERRDGVTYVNIPILFAGASIGNLNMTDAGDRFRDTDFPVFRVLAALLLPLLLAGAVSAEI
jgi:hypothetical protein